jgi:hypothetical protein
MTDWDDMSSSLGTDSDVSEYEKGRLEEALGDFWSVAINDYHVGPVAEAEFAKCVIRESKSKDFAEYFNKLPGLFSADEPDLPANAPEELQKNYLAAHKQLFDSIRALRDAHEVMVERMDPFIEALEAIKKDDQEKTAVAKATKLAAKEAKKRAKIEARNTNNTNKKAKTTSHI